MYNSFRKTFKIMTSLAEIFTERVSKKNCESYIILGIAKEGDARTASIILERNSNLDKKEMDSRVEEKMSYLMLALENYAKALIKSDKHDLKMYRWISLWFANFEEDKVNHTVETFLDIIPDHKFVGLLYQLCARMVTKRDSKFPQILLSLIQK